MSSLRVQLQYGPGSLGAIRRHSRIDATIFRSHEKKESGDDEEEEEGGGLSGRMRKAVGRASDPQPGDHQEGSKVKGTPDGDLDVLSASGQVQTSSLVSSVQERRAQIDSCWCNIPDMFVDPASRKAYYWMALVTVAVVYNWIVIILRVAFEDMREGDFSSKMFRVLDIISDVIYLMDVAIQFRTAYLEDGCLVKTLPETVRHYRSQPRFFLDVLSIVPLTKIFSFLSAINPLPFFQSGLDSISTPGMRVLRLLKYPSMIRFFEKTDSRTNNPNLLRAFKLSLHLWLVIHWICCVYYLISRHEGLGVNDWVYPNTTEYSSFSRKYIVCMYWSTMTLTTIGERPWPVTDVEFIFTGLTFLIGVFVFAAVVGNVGDVISNMNAARHDFQARMDQIKFYLNHRHVPEHLQDQIKRWAEYTWARTKAIDEHSIMQLLPGRLRTEVAIHVHLKALKKVRIFEQCEEGLLRELVLKLRPSIYSPGEYICRIGEIGREMYIIDHGKVEILFPDRKNGIMKQVAVMMPGNYFGEISLLKLDDGQNKRTADVRSIGFSELLCLSRRDLMSALMEYPEAKKVLETQARERMQQTKWTSSEPCETSASVEAVNPKKPTGRRSARSIFAEVMKQEGFADLLSSKANQELAEMKKLLKEIEGVKKLLSDTSVYQLSKQCQSVEEQLAQKDQELQRLRAQLLDKRLQSGLVLPQDSLLPSQGYDISTARQSPIDSSVDPRHNAYDSGGVAIHKRCPLSSVKAGVHSHVSSEHSQQADGLKGKGSLGGGGDELVVPKIHVSLGDHHAESCNTEISPVSTENDTDLGSVSTLFKSPLQSGTSAAPSQGSTPAGAEVAQSDFGFNLASVDMPSQKQNDDDDEKHEKESNSTSSNTDTSGSTSSSGSGGRGTGPKPAKPKPRFKSKGTCESNSPKAYVGDGCESGQKLRDGLHKKKTPVKSARKICTKLEGCLSSEGFSAVSSASESWGTESISSSSARTGSTKLHAPDMAVWGRHTSLNNQLTKNVHKINETQDTENTTLTEQVSAAVPNQQQPWDDPTMMEAAGISPENLAYLHENGPSDNSGKSLSSDENDDKLISATRVRSDFDKRASKEEFPTKVITCSKISDTQLSVLLAMRRKANDCADNIVESIKRPDLSRSLVEHSHSVHAAIDSRVSKSKEEFSPFQTLDSNEMEHEVTAAYRTSSASPHSRDAKVRFFITPQTAIETTCENDKAVEDASCIELTQDEGTADIPSFAEPAREMEEAMQSKVESGESSGLSNIQHDLRSGETSPNTDKQIVGEAQLDWLNEDEENEIKYTDSILKKPQCDISSEETKENTRCEESAEISHQVDCKSVGEENSTSATMILSPYAVTASDCSSDTGGHADKDEGFDCQSTVDHKIPNGKKLKRSRNRDIDVEMGIFHSKLKNNTNQSVLGAKDGDSLPDPPESSLHEDNLAIPSPDGDSLPEPPETSLLEDNLAIPSPDGDSLPDPPESSLLEDNHAIPPPDTEHQEFQYDQGEEDEESFAILRRRYSASRYRRRSIDRVHDVADGSPVDTDSDFSADRDNSSEIAWPMTSDCTGPIRKPSEKLDVLATFDSSNKKYVQDDSICSAEKISATTYPHPWETANVASTETADENKASANVDKDPKTVAAMSKLLTVEKKGNSTSKEEIKDGDVPKRSFVPINNPPPKRKALRRRSLTKRLSNPGGKMEVQTSEITQAACLKEIGRSCEKRSEKDSVCQESLGEGAVPSVLPEKNAEQEKDRERKLVYLGLEGETRHGYTRGCTVLSRLGTNRASAKTSDSALGDYDSLQKKRVSSYLGFENVDNLNSSSDCRRIVSRADSQAASQRKNNPSSISPVCYIDTIQQSASRPRSYEAMDRANNSALTSDDSNSSIPFTQKNSISVSEHPCYNAAEPKAHFPQSLMDHVADQASMVVQNLLRPSTPSPTGSSTELVHICQPYGNISNSMSQPWNNDNGDEEHNFSLSTSHASASDAQGGVLEESAKHGHMQLKVESDSEQVLKSTKHDHFHAFADTSGRDFQVGKKPDHSHMRAENAQDHTQPNVESTLDHTDMDFVLEDQSVFADFSHSEENSRISDIEGSQEDSGLMERIVGGAMVEAMRLNPSLLASVGASDNERERVGGEAHSLMLLADFGVEDDDEGALSDMSGCGDHSDANTDLDSM